MANVELLDTTLRDGAQSHGISYSVEDKLKILACLDGVGVPFIEAGNPGSNQKDREFLERAASQKLSCARLVAFGSTRKPSAQACDDYSLRAIVSSGVKAASIVGKAWDFHVSAVLGTDNATNIDMIESSIAYLAGKGIETFFDAEHFFDGYAANPAYALECLEAACSAGARVLVLCDTNGGAFPSAIARAVAAAAMRFGDRAAIGIHAHNDGGMAVANTVCALEAGAAHAQVTVNGYGERCGNADLCAVAANVELKLGKGCLLAPDGLSRLFRLSREVAEIANMPPDGRAPYVGVYAFAHKGGMHVDGVDKAPETFEHVDPALVGNERRYLMSEVSGRGALVGVVSRLIPGAGKGDPALVRAAARLKELEFAGYQYEGAEASLELEMKRLFGLYKPGFELQEFKVIVGEPSVGAASSSAIIKIRANGEDEISAAEGAGPVEALDRAIRKALARFFPEIARMKLTDYKVRVIDSGAATAAKVRVLIESSDDETRWTTVGVSEDIIQASWKALVDSIEYKLGAGR